MRKTVWQKDTIYYTGWQNNYNGAQFSPSPNMVIATKLGFWAFQDLTDFFIRNKIENKYKVDYQRLKDLSWDNICVKSINTKYDKIVHFKLHTEYGYFWELFLKWTEFIPKMGIFGEIFGNPKLNIGNYKNTRL